MTDRSVYVRLKADVNQYQRDMLKAEASTKSLSQRLDEADGRMSGLIQTGLALAPALIPIGAVAVPAVVALATQLGVAGAAAGVTLLAFNGVGKGLEALNTYQLEPTTQNFAKLQEAMKGLGPEAQSFIGYLQTIRPELDKLRKAAQGGLLPGAQQGLEELMQLAPLAEKVIGHMATTVGRLLAEAGDNLNDPRWVSFFTYLDIEAQPILMDLGRTMGNVFEGIANTIEAFMPLTVDFSTGMLNMSRDFRKWSEGLGSSQGFSKFVDYVRSAGPAVLDTLGSLAGAILAIVEAGAPVGRILLPVIGELADGIAALANSPLGPIMISAAAAVGVLGRSLALLKAVGLKGGTSFLQRDYIAPTKNVIASFRDMRTASEQLRAAEAQRVAMATRARDAQFAMIPDQGKRKAINDYTAALGQQRAATERVTEAEKARSGAMRGAAGSFGKAAAVAGGLALATSGVADKFKLSNTMSMALMGTIAGPWGAAIGGGIGLAMDFASAIHHSSLNQQALNTAAKEVAQTLNEQNGAITANTRQTAAKALADQGVYDAAKTLGINLGDVTDAYLQNAGAAGRVGEQIMRVRDAQGGEAVMSEKSKKAWDLVQGAIVTTGGAMSDTRRHILQMREAQDANTNASKNLGGAFHTEAMSLDELINRLQKANNATLTNRGSMRDYKASVDAARAALKQNGKTLDDNTAKGRANNAALDAMASAAIKHAGTMNDDGKSIKRVNGYLQQSRKDLINAAEHFGMTRKQAINYANSVLKIPKDARTRAIFDHQVAKSQIKDYVNYVNQQLKGGIHDKTVKLIMDAQSSHIRSELSWLRKASGGDIHGPGTGTSDSIPALLSDNEHVVTNAEVKAFGHGNYQQGHKNIKLWRQAALHGNLPDPNDLPRYADGGSVLHARTTQKPPPAGAVIRADSAAFARMAQSISSALSGALNKQVHQAGQTGGGRPLGPNGSLSLGQIVVGQRFANAQAGKPYIWGGVGPRGYDCSGFQSAILNAAHGRNPYSRIGSTGSMPWPGSRPGVGRYTIGWFKGSPGHTSGNIGGLGVESTGDHVRTGSAARSPMNSMFSGHMHYAKGGAVEVPVIGLSDEYMMSGDAVRHYGVKTFDAMNARRLHTGGPVGFAKGGSVTAPASVTRDISARITQMRNALDTSKFYHTLVPYIRHRLSGKQEQSYLDRAHRAFVSDMKRNDMDRIRAATTALRKSDTPNKDYAQLASFIRRHLTGREERDRLGSAKDAFTADQKRIRDAQLAAAHKKQTDAINKVTTELNKLKDSAANLREQRDALVTQVGSSFVSDPFGGTLGGFTGQLGYENRRLAGANVDLAKLAKGKMGPALLSQLASSGNANLIHQFAQLSPSELAAQQALWDRRNRLQKQVGTVVGNEVYGADTRALQTRIDRLTAELARLRKGGGGIHFHGKVVARDADSLAKKIDAKRKTAVRVARTK